MGGGLEKFFVDNVSKLLWKVGIKLENMIYIG